MEKRVIALGFFDGVHQGHSALLTKAVQRAQELGVAPAVLSFDVHPDNLIVGQDTKLLNTTEDREYIVKKYFGIEQVLLEHFDHEFMRMPWEQFVEQELMQRYGAVHVIAGHDFHFGYKGMGNPQRLQEKCGELGIGCDIIDKVVCDGITVSSTYIRGLVAQGEIELANQFLGHPHTMAGTVVVGRRLGRRLDMPTVNFSLPQGILAPGNGVYVTRVLLENGESYPGVTNVGVKPTVDDDGSVSVETNIIGFSGDLYGRKVRLEFLKFLRPEKKFADLEELKAAVHENIRQAAEYFEEK